ncbi:GMC oxidoreductase [Propionivibrio sp.]|uniref:GMC oxidoreductase n=1 Tax=Propionivibrio sp. TaxID=2212460 RepID=UPI002626086B|nr:GMC oxidoreductase [Propionivibrio sp.]
MRAITTEIQIEAPIALVWQLVFDVAGYNDWNPFISHVHGAGEERSFIDFKVHLPGAQTALTRVEVLKVVPEREFVWLGHLFNVSGLIDGEHSFELFSLGPTSTRVVHSERFRGKMLPLLGTFTTGHVRQGLDMMNVALRWRAERVLASASEEKESNPITEEDPSELSKTYWDAIVVGTGMGGATLGYALARGGQRVLFLEKGENYLTNPKALRGDYMEILSQQAMGPDSEEEMSLQGGRWWGEIFDAVKGQFIRPFMGIGTGGSSALYGMVMERFFLSDFEPKRYHRGDTESTLPERWPISYHELRPFYAEAEALFHVESREGPDPFRGGDTRESFKATIPRHLATRMIEGLMRKKNIHIYSLPSACEWKAGCRYCQNFLCDKGCKNDAATACLQPALEHHGAVLVTRFAVDRLESNQGAVTAVHGRWRGQQGICFHGRRVILAAGALASPLLLLQSRSELWPQCLANGSGAVGRNLMRQLTDLYLLPSIWNFSKDPFTLKENGWNDFYVVNGVKYGTVQCYGKFVHGSIAMKEYLFSLSQGTHPWLAKIVDYFHAGIARCLDALFVRSGIGSIIMEDLPYWENRVEAMEPAPDGRERICVHYRISRYDQERLVRFRRMYEKAIRPYFYLRAPISQSLKGIANASGTVRFGDDPKTSVLNKMNRAHEVENLYVVDASFFPSSGGINPSLTIAANALRVAEHILSFSRMRPCDRNSARGR